MTPRDLDAKVPSSEGPGFTCFDPSVTRPLKRARMDEQSHLGDQMPATIGRYKVLESIGFGAMGAVYKAFDPLIKRTLAEGETAYLPLDKRTHVL